MTRHHTTRRSGGAGSLPAQSASTLRPSPDSLLCMCPEPAATGEDWPDNMHTHDGCAVYHRLRECAIGQARLPLT